MFLSGEFNRYLTSNGYFNMENLQKIIPANYAVKNKVLPLDSENGQVTVAMANAGNHELLSELRFIFNKKIIPEEWAEKELLEAIYQAYQLTDERLTAEGNNLNFEYLEKRVDAPVGEESPKVEDRSVIQLVNRFISEAIRLKASDIHVESYEDDFRIRFRIDGKLIEYDKPARIKKQSIVSRLKIMADLDIAEKRRPQDGRIRMSQRDQFLKNGPKTVDIRVSTMPTDFGEKVVLRILDKSALKLSLDLVGFDDRVLENFRKILKMPYGLVLVTGPTGSGKTTTLYAALNYVNHPDVNIITIEDPVEYNLHGINQTMIKPEIGLTFAGILRTVLRQDPNIIMVGEIRDSETAEIAVRAALTGHLVLSTLHTNDAISTIIRLTDMGIEPFLVANSLKMVIAQRLIRKNCPKCKTTDHIDREFFDKYHLPDTIRQHRFYRGEGCQYCNHTGFSGREAVIEHLVMDDDFSDLILNRANLTELRTLAKKKGLATLSDIGLNKAIDGTTSLPEVIYETFMG